MPFSTVRLLPGVKLEQTPSLLQASIIESQNIRWRGGLPEKIGGWTQFYPFGFTTGIIRHLWPWADNNAVSHLGVVGDSDAVVLTDETASLVITPEYYRTNNPPSFSTTLGSSLVLIDDVGSNTNVFESVMIANHVSVGGLSIYGYYPIVSVQSADQYTIDAGALATSTSSTDTMTVFTTAAGSAFVNVKFPNHGKQVGGYWPIAVPVVVDVNTLYGYYDIIAIVDPDNLTIASLTQAVNTVSVTDNGGNVQLTYWLANLPPPPGGGWGDGGWGLGAWGESVPPPPIAGTKITDPSSIFYPIRDWSIANFGEDLIFGPVGGGPIFVWDVDLGLQGSHPMPNAPVACNGFFVGMPEQQVIAYGAADINLLQDPMLVRWCDNGDYTDWVATAANQAGSYRLPRGSMIVGGMQTPQQAMLWTDVGLWLMQYIGYPNVFGFFEIAQECGLIAKDAAVVIGGRVVWMGWDNFWSYASGSVQPMPCEVWDQVFPIASMVDQNNLYKIRAASNTQYNEVTWYFPSAGGNGENDSYVRFNVLSGEWDYGSLSITEWTDYNIYGPPLSAMYINGQPVIMQHEVAQDANGEAITYGYKTGYFVLAEGEEKVFVDLIVLDFKWRRRNQPSTTSAQLLITLYTCDFPDDPNGDTEVAYGPYVVSSNTGSIEPRARGRYFAVGVQGNDIGSFSRLGGLKFRFAPDGRN